MAVTLFTHKVFTNADGVEICTDPGAFVFETRIDLYRGMMEGGTEFSSHIQKARIRSNVKQDSLEFLKVPNVPVLAVSTDHNDKIVLAITSKIDDYDLTPIWEIVISNQKGIATHRAGTTEKMTRLFRETVKQGQAAISGRTDIVSGMKNMFMK